MNTQEYVDFILKSKFTFSDDDSKRLLYLKEKDFDLTSKEIEEMEDLLLSSLRYVNKQSPDRCNDDQFHREDMVINGIRIWVKTSQIDPHPYIDVEINGTSSRLERVFIRDNLSKEKNKLLQYLYKNRKTFIDYWFSLIYSDQFYDRLA